MFQILKLFLSVKCLFQTSSLNIIILRKSNLKVKINFILSYKNPKIKYVQEHLKVKCVIMGDFNIDFGSQNGKESKLLRDFIEDFGLRPINEYTRITERFIVRFIKLYILDLLRVDLRKEKRKLSGETFSGMVSGLRTQELMSYGIHCIKYGWQPLIICVPSGNEKYR